MNIRQAWEAFERGDINEIPDDGLRMMLDSSIAAEAYLVARGDSLMVFKIRLDISRLTDAVKVRKAEVEAERARLRSEFGRDLGSLCGLPPGKYPALERAARKVR